LEHVCTVVRTHCPPLPLIYPNHSAVKHGRCRGKSGGCVCVSGADIDECLTAAKNPCQHGVKCVNTPGSYQCIHQVGFTYDSHNSIRGILSSIITFCVSRRRRKMYSGHARLCVCLCVCLSVCLSAAVRPHYCTDPDVTWGCGRGCPLVVHYWADLQSVHGLRCYGNITRTLVTSLRPSRDMTI